jgi:hypothetical protein
MIFVEWDLSPKFSKLVSSPYIDHEYNYDENPVDTRQGGYYRLKPGVPPEIVKLNKEFKKLEDARDDYCRKTGLLI